VASIRKILPGWLKRWGRSLIWKWRLQTARFRVLPDFLIIGVQKGGTTSLYAYLEQHPQILPSYRKEIEFFDGGKHDYDQFQNGERWYRAHFPLKMMMRPGKKTFEASPSYIFNPQAPERIHEMLPNVKLILLLRNPTERAVSHYFHMKRQGSEPLPMLEAFKEEEERLAPVWGTKDYNTRTFDFLSYKSRGKYEEQISRYLKYFPRNQLLIIESDEFYHDLEGTLKRIFAYVGVDETVSIRDLKARNVSENRTEIDPEVREYLDGFFEPYNQKLYALIGKNYKWQPLS
jgi:hypothetical protein